MSFANIHLLSEEERNKALGIEPEKEDKEEPETEEEIEEETE